MDLELPVLDGVAATSAITRQFPDARIVVLTVHQGMEDVYRALQAGAITYILKDTLTKDLIRVIRQVHAGERPLPPEVLELMAKGLSNRHIALRLAISDETVHAHAKNIFSKLHVGDRTRAVTEAFRRGIIHLR